MGPTEGMHVEEAGGGEEGDLLVMAIESSSSIPSLTLPNELSNATHFFLCASPKRSVLTYIRRNGYTINCFTK